MPSKTTTIIVAVIAAAIVGFIIYYFFTAKKQVISSGGNSGGGPTPCSSCGNPNNPPLLYPTPIGPIPNPFNIPGLKQLPQLLTRFPYLFVHGVNNLFNKVISAGGDAYQVLRRILV